MDGGIYWQRRSHGRQNLPATLAALITNCPSPQESFRKRFGPLYACKVFLKWDWRGGLWMNKTIIISLKIQDIVDLWPLPLLRSCVEHFNKTCRPFLRFPSRRCGATSNPQIWFTGWHILKERQWSCLYERWGSSPRTSGGNQFENQPALINNQVPISRQIKDC